MARSTASPSSARTQPGGLVDQGVHRQSGQALAELVGGGEHQMPQPHDGTDPHRACRAFRHQQRPQGFDVASARLGETGDTARQRPAGSLDRVQLVALAVTPALLAVGAINLDHHQPLIGKMASEARPIRARALDTDTLDNTERHQPRVQREMPGWCRRERLDAEHTAVGVDDRGHVNVQMCVDSARHRTRRTYDGHVIPFLC